MNYRCLEIGPGDNPLPEKESNCQWESIAFEAQWGFESLEFEDNTFDQVYASHVFEHVPWNVADFALKEVLRILRPGGTFEVWVPDFKKIVQAYLDKKPGDKWRRENQNGDYMRWVNGRLFTYGPGPDNRHHACYDAEYLTRCLREAGFRNVEHIPKRIRGISHGMIDLGARGTK